MTNITQVVDCFGSLCSHAESKCCTSGADIPGTSLALSREVVAWQSLAGFREQTGQSQQKMDEENSRSTRTVKIIIEKLVVPGSASRWKDI